MTEYLSPNVFIQERKATAGAVAGVSTSTFASVGWLQKGPVNSAQLVTSFQSFVNTFGGYWRKSILPFQMALFYQNTNGNAYIVRVVPTDATKSALSSSDSINGVETSATFYSRPLAATLDLSTNSNINLKVDAGSAADVDCVGSTPAATTREEIRAAIDAVSGVTCTLTSDYRLKIVSGTTGSTSQLVFGAPASGDASKTILGLDPSADGIATTYTYTGSDVAGDWTFEAAWQGAWYDQVRMVITGNRDSIDANENYTKFDVEIQEESSPGAGDWATLESYQELVFDDDTDEDFVSDIITDRTDYMKILAGSINGNPADLTNTDYNDEFAIDVSGESNKNSLSGTVMNTEVVEGSVTFKLVFDTEGAMTVTDDGDGNLESDHATVSVTGTFDYDTGAWTMELTPSTDPNANDIVLVDYSVVPAATSVIAQLTGGTDGTSVSRNDVSESALAATRGGIYAFDEVDDILNLAIPDFSSDIDVVGDMVSYAENRDDRDIFVITSSPEGYSATDVSKWMRKKALFNSKYLAVYWPRVKITDPMATDGRMIVQPSDGIIAGIFAKNDNLANVGTSPGGIVRGSINGIQALELTVVQGERDIVSPSRINVLRADTWAGKSVWGVRTTSMDAEWRYINHTRLFMYLEKSLKNASPWVFFENNGPALWGRVKAQFDGFLKNRFDDGYFAGETPAEAFLVKVDEDNNPQSSIDAGILTIDIFVAPNKPAEFVRLRFTQKTRS